MQNLQDMIFIAFGCIWIIMGVTAVIALFKLRNCGFPNLGMTGI